MSKCTARNLEFLKSISKCNELSRKQSLTSCSNDSIKAISEIALNTLKGNLKLTPLQIRQLKKHKKNVRQLAKKKLSVKEKRKLLIQQGGFLPFLIVPFLSALGSFAGKAIANSAGF
jgi:hypothetical protein